MRLLEIIQKVRQENRTDLASLTVMSAATDPYRQCAGTEAIWFVEQLERFCPYGQIHLRGLHYRIVAAGDILRPDRAPYINTDECWAWLCRAGKAARWLSHVEFSRITDARNDPPEIYIPSKQSIWWELEAYSLAECPTLAEALPRFHCDQITVRQPNRLVLIGEKMSLASVLRPIAQEVGGEMLLPTGEPSDTMIAELAERAARDDRRTVIFYLSDFDPAGRQMPISVGRKLQAISQRDFPDLEAELHHIAVTLQQVEEYNLPSTPLKETERRADKWRAVMGREQTEIDALLALHEGALHGIIMQAITPFYDAHLQARADEMRFNWLEDANDSLRSHPDYRQRAGDIEEALVDLRVAYKRLEQTQQQLIALNDGHDSGTLTQSEPVIDAVAPEPLFTTRDNYITATKKLRAYRAMEEVS